MRTTAQDTANRYAGFSLEHLLGTDKFGRDIFTRLCYGGRISLSIGFGAAVINTVLGVVIGGLCGYIGGKFDTVVMRIVDIIYAMPSMIYVILIMMVFGSNVRSILIGICIPGWIGMARQVRSQLIALKEQEFAMAALVIGAGDARDSVPPSGDQRGGAYHRTGDVSGSQCDFHRGLPEFHRNRNLGADGQLGARWPRTRGRYFSMYPVQLLLPTLCICITIFALNFLGEGIGDAFNPKKSMGVIHI